MLNGVRTLSCDATCGDGADTSQLTCPRRLPECTADIAVAVAAEAVERLLTEGSTRERQKQAEKECKRSRSRCRCLRLSGRQSS
ncbi:hypothetical protein NDU88_003582 [Pleurodeles waltl]|uniref:Uncharacterized protein n=1 Tax=Pleurodeles waltl TaxID=8319 RepID=A0AAV7T5C8_PLEWA|nr:hypothetical protein NDU88_003582 [Pleurodeles waltl]